MGNLRLKVSSDSTVPSGVLCELRFITHVSITNYWTTGYLQMKGQKDYRLLKQFIFYSHDILLEFWIVMAYLYFSIDCSHCTCFR